MSAIARHYTTARAFGFATVLVVLWGWQAQLGRFMTPERGIGYVLGIVGGCSMVLLLLYPARKRVRWLNFLGSVPEWFQLHMVLGIVGPVCILFHANFGLGATNSNVALFCMLAVVGSGVIGRYFYTRLHAKLDGRQASLAELQNIADTLSQQASVVAVLPDLLAAIEAEERHLLEPAHGSLGRVLHVFTVGLRAMAARWRLHRLIDRAVRDSAGKSATIAQHAERLRLTARRYADKRLDASRRVSEFRVYTRLFGLWHLLHVPLLIMLIIAGVVHVISVQIY
ncbi:MAG: hypothetical protein U1F30_07255 [Steroidobacteraceae bacterium]